MTPHCSTIHHTAAWRLAGRRRRGLATGLWVFLLPATFGGAGCGNAVPGNQAAEDQAAEIVDPLDPGGADVDPLEVAVDPAALRGRFGLFAGVRYADQPPQPPLRFRAAADRLADAVAALRFLETGFTVQLGDLIDGHDAASALARVASTLGRLPTRVESVVGDRDLTLDFAALSAALAVPAADDSDPRSLRHRAFVAWGWRFIVLDTLDVAVLGRPSSAPEHSLARAYLLTHPAAAYPDVRPDCGAVGDKQLTWLRDQLVLAEDHGQHVCVFSHHPFVADIATSAECCWNGDEVAAVLGASPTVVACFSGHARAAKHGVVGGVHHLAMPAMVAAEDPQGAWATVGVYQDRLEVRGRGSVKSRSLARNPMPTGAR